jgi:hypothetical protein
VVFAVNILRQDHCFATASEPLVDAFSSSHKTNRTFLELHCGGSDSLQIFSHTIGNLDGRKDGRTDTQTDGWTDRRSSLHSQPKYLPGYCQAGGLVTARLAHAKSGSVCGFLSVCHPACLSIWPGRQLRSRPPRAARTVAGLWPDLLRAQHSQRYEPDWRLPGLGAVVHGARALSGHG